MNKGKKNGLLVTGIVLLAAGLIWRILLMAAFIVLVGRFMWIRKNQPEWDELADRTYKQDAQRISAADSKVQTEKKELVPYLQAVQGFIPAKYYSLKAVQGLLTEFQKGASTMYEATQGYEAELMRELKRRHYQAMEQEAAAQIELARQNLAANTATASHTGQAAWAAENSARSQSRTAAAAKRSASADEAAAREAYYMNSMLDDYLM